MRDKHFVAEHRGGLLPMRDHRLLTRWAADCAEHILEAVWTNEKDRRPFQAVEQARAWSRGENRVGDCQKAAVAAHAAARACKDPAAIAAARCAGHAVATAHMADHCFGVGYALRAAGLAGMDVEKERAWQKKHLPRQIRNLVLSGEEHRRALGRTIEFRGATTVNRRVSKKTEQQPRPRRRRAPARQ
ncbi:MAG: hypothetical protein JWO95_3291 [Verrucomicrobiales bacterium]|nr:hypothetical protein [Verrucomicrobiales bacterium]